MTDQNQVREILKRINKDNRNLDLSEFTNDELRLLLIHCEVITSRIIAKFDDAHPCDMAIATPVNNMRNSVLWRNLYGSTSTCNGMQDSMESSIDTLRRGRYGHIICAVPTLQTRRAWADAPYTHHAIYSTDAGKWMFDASYKSAVEARMHVEKVKATLKLRATVISDVPLVDIHKILDEINRAL